MGTLIRIIFREGKPRRGGEPHRRLSAARERGLNLWRARDDVVFATAYRAVPRPEIAEDTQSADRKTLKFAPLG